MAKPDWSEWNFTPDVMVWQACALSLDLEPRKLLHSSTGWMSGDGSGPFFEPESFPTAADHEEFRKRMRILLKNLPEQQHFSPRTSSLVTPGNSEVCLGEFVAWGKSVVSWTIPAELAALAKHRVGSIASAAAPTRGSALPPTPAPAVSTSAEAEAGNSHAPSVSEQRNLRVLEACTALGIDPLAIPLRPLGNTPGLQSKLRGYFANQPTRMTDKQIEHAVSSLKSDGRMKDAEPGQP